MSKRAEVGEPQAIRLRPFATIVGTVVAYALMVAGGFVLATSGIGSVIFLQPAVQFGALLVGGYLAGRIAGTSGFINGVAVAVVFIAIWAVQNAFFEARLVREYGPLALPRMNMGGIILGDLLNLSAAAFGGWLSEKTR
jgi:hypothetical protein